MTTLVPWIERRQHFTSEVRGQFWGDLAQHTRQSWQDFFGRLSIEAWDRYLGVREYERSPDRADARNGFYDRAFLSSGFPRLERRAAEMLLLIREAFLRGLSTRAVGRVVALVREVPVSAQTVSRRTTNVIERCFVEVRRRTRPMVCFVNARSVVRIIFSIFNRFNLAPAHLRRFTQVG